MAYLLYHAPFVKRRPLGRLPSSHACHTTTPEDARPGRPSRWRRDDLVSAAGHLRAVLARETQGRVSVNSFTGQYLPVLDFPSDIVEALGAGRINLQEAAQLARMTHARLGCTAAAARKQRDELLRSH